MKANVEGKLKTITKANGCLELLMVGLDTYCTKSVISYLTLLGNCLDLLLRTYCTSHSPHAKQKNVGKMENVLRNRGSRLHTKHTYKP